MYILTKKLHKFFNDVSVWMFKFNFEYKFAWIVMNSSSWRPLNLTIIYDKNLE